jgi:hypothetical protein
LDLVNDLKAVIHASQQAIHSQWPGDELIFESFFLRRQQKESVSIHAAFASVSSNHALPFFLLIDRAEGHVWMWQAHLRYLGDWAKRAGSKYRCPPLLVVSPSHFRAGAMLRLARAICPNLTVIATGCRNIAMREGLLAVSKQPKGWRILLPNNKPAAVDPFALPGIPRADYQNSPFAIDKLARPSHVGDVEINQAQAREESARFLALDAYEHQVLALLCRNPVIPESAFATFLSVPPAALQKNLQHLEQAGFAQRIKTNLAEPIWAASDLGAQLCFDSEMQPANHLRRYCFFRADHERRLMHTLGVYRFFESLHHHCERRSRATRKLDAKGSVNDGNVPMFKLKTWESEFMASDRYVLRGQMHFWRPDGYGAVRAGKITTHFWLEIDGTANSPSRYDPAVWEGKLGRLCDYIQSRRWTFRYPKLPRLLIVTTDLRNASHVYDALIESARARGLRTLPRVFIAGADAIHQRGPLAKVWLEVGQEEESWCYAFEGVEVNMLTPRMPRRVNVLDELRRADEMGLLPLGGG